jgi:hypothetical protein
MTDLTTLTVNGAQEGMRLISKAINGNAIVSNALTKPLIILGQYAEATASWLKESRLAQDEAVHLAEKIGSDKSDTRDLTTACAECVELQALIDAVGHEETKAVIRSTFRSALISKRNEE